MKKLYQKEWFSIPFDSFSTMDSKNIAGKKFYDQFYNEFYKKFKCYDELPEQWRTRKGLIADFILKNSSLDSKLLSVGCGIGYIESILKCQKRDITAIEPSARATDFLNKEIKIYHGYFPQCLLDQGNQIFDLIYFVDTDYVFDRTELVNLLKSASVHCKTLIFFSIFVNNSFTRIFKDFLRSSATLFGIYRQGQFWGYLRTPSELSDCFKQAGFQDVEHGFLDQESYWVKGKALHGK